ncbi:Olfactory receptor 10C1 [Varanus komodoensis]|uniref:olfactory receptor 10P1-like n=1 Tax=Varanus komodoensis TaxID=61221 RepID=UPI001CF7D059|nr:olfactory receptor 10P1-like [Varanus komodoensis]KAF7235644.1 Olfactory receptor 10C1 [Varanus komodoensis]
MSPGTYLNEIKKEGNLSCLTEIVLLGFSDVQNMWILLFWLVLMFYLVTLSGNSILLILTVANPCLHTPMYFFLCNLSFLEIGYTSTIIPKMLQHLWMENQAISFGGCGVQMYFFILFGITECCLLCVMAYDRYIAICKPLQYAFLMSLRECAQLAAISWAIGILVAFGQSISIFTLPFCGPNEISHFFCDVLPVLRLATTNTFKNEVAVATVTVFFILVPFLLILLSYIFIISSILIMPSAQNRHKAFSTCSSHLIVVSLFYGTVTFTYIRPKSVYSLDSDRILSLLYTVVTPAFNPIIYSLRNKEIKAAFRKSIERKQGFI